MDNKEITEAETLENRISEMKSQFQKSYDVFIKAHEELSRISFDSEAFSAQSGDLGSLAKLETDDINEILNAGSIDECISALRSKIPIENVNTQNTFPDVSKLLAIMNSLQTDIESLSENQKQYTKLSNEVNAEMSMFEKRMEESICQLDNLAVETVDDLESSQSNGDCSDEQEEENFGSESFSD